MCDYKQSGQFIVFEGIDGVGKTTQAKLLRDNLQKLLDVDVIYTREPGGTPAGEAIRNLLMTEDLHHTTEAALFAAARAEHLEKLIIPETVKGNWIISDRFIDSSIAYQGRYSDLTESDIRDIHLSVCGGILPDLTIVISADKDMSRDRLQERGELDRIESRDESYRTEVANSFLRLSANKNNYKLVISNDSIEETSKEILKLVKAKFKDLIK